MLAGWRAMDETVKHMVLLPAEAVQALRARVAAFLVEQGHAQGEGLDAVDVDNATLAGFLLAAVRYSRDEHPRTDGSVATEPEIEAWSSPFALAHALADHAGPITADDIVAVVERVLALGASLEPHRRVTPAPWPYPHHVYPFPDALREVELFQHTFELVGATDWPDDLVRRDVLLRRVLTNDSVMHFVDLDAGEAARLAGFLIAGPERWTDGAAQAPAAAALVRVYGPRTRCFGTPDLRGLPVGALLEDSSRSAAAWSHYARWDSGSWGSFAALVLTDGRQLAYLDAVWDVASEG